MRGRFWSRNVPKKPRVSLDGEAGLDCDSRTAADTVRGERRAAFARRVRSVHARLNALLATALVIGVALAMLSWYYTRTLHGERVSPAAATHVSTRTLVSGPRPLGPLPSPERSTAPEVQRPADQPAATAAEALRRAALEQPPLAQTPRQFSRSASLGQPLEVPAVRKHPRKTLTRLLTGPVFKGTSSVNDNGTTKANDETLAGAYPAAFAAARSGTGSRLQALLRPTVMRATRAQLLPQRRLLLAKGTFIACTLETAIDSTLPGMTTCITARDTFSADGTVVLLERGTELIGETRGQVRQGRARVFVIWTEARTPTGVVVRLDSPSTDALGRSGLTGVVNRHFWERFGAALLVSTITGLAQSRTQTASGTVIVDPTESEDMVAGILRSTENIPPTVQVPSGQRIEVLVARDVDFRPVYELLAR